MSRYSRWARKEHSQAARLAALIPAGIIFLLLIPYLLLVISPSLDARLGLDLFNRRPATLILGVGLLLAGLPLALWSVLSQFTRARGTPLPMMPTQRLLTSGPFQYCRNPMTLGTLLAYLGLAIGAATIVGVLLVAAFAALLLLYLKRMEEPELLERFGDEYRAYRQRVPFILPRAPKSE